MGIIILAIITTFVIFSVAILVANVIFYGLHLVADFIRERFNLKWFDR